VLLIKWWPGQYYQAPVVIWVNNGLFVTIGELGGMASFAVFLVHIYLLLDSTNGRLPR